MSTQRVLAADVYDTLELAALANGGIGGWARHDEWDCPLCVLGLAAFASLEEADAWYGSPIEVALEATRIWGATNDSAVVTINGKKGVHPPNQRVSFREWCKELDVVRAGDWELAFDPSVAVQ